MKRIHRPFEGARRSRALVPRSGRGHLPQIYLSETNRAAQSVYQPDHPHQLGAARLRWLISTLLAAAVGVLAIGAAVFSAMDRDRAEGSMMAFVEKTVRQSISPVAVAALDAPLPTNGKSDRLSAATRGSVTVHYIKDQVQERRGGKDFITWRPYGRIVARLAAVPTDHTDQIPAFNPFTLYKAAPGSGDAASAETQSAGTAAVAVRDPDGGLLPAADGLELRPAEIVEVVLKDREASSEEATMQDGGGSAESATDASPGAGETIPPEPLPPDTMAIAKNVLDEAGASPLEGQEVRVVQAGDGDTLSRILKRNDVDAGTAKAVVAAALKVVDGEGLAADQEIRLVLAPGSNDQLQPALVTVFSEAHSHLVTVTRTASGSFEASADPQTAELASQLRGVDNKGQHSSLYNSFYSAGLSQGLPADMIMRMVRTFAYDTDFRRRVGPGDGFEAFYDIVGEEKSGHGPVPGHPGQLLYASLTVGGETRKFYRYRTPDGLIDYYDVQGNNAKKFLMQRPVRGDVRFTSGFGLRLHPLLRVKKMHTGIDWAGAAGTPILAAGNGVITEIGRKGGNGNYVRIRHANGYETAYSHMLKFASGLRPGSKVAQGDVIGYIGTTGLSTGAHLHFEILINSSFVDPMSITVPRDRQLAGRLLTDFQKERAHIEELMNRAPVATLVDQVSSNG